MIQLPRLHGCEQGAREVLLAGDRRLRGAVGWGRVSWSRVVVGRGAEGVEVWEMEGRLVLR